MTSPRLLSGPPRRTRLAWLWATFFGAGYLRPGPGTYGSLAAALLWMGWFHFFPAAAVGRSLQSLFAVLVASVTGIAAATRVSRESGSDDPGFVVIDEVAGQWLALSLARDVWPAVLLAFLLFRLFDIAKPWPIRLLEKLPEGMGIMLDDLGAGLLAAVAYALLIVPWLRLFARTLPHHSM